MKIESQLDNLFSDLRDGAPVREDSRAFGAMIEKRITDNWKEICKSVGSEPMQHPGRRTIYDFACTLDDQIFGFDVKTKDLDSSSYSDGGVCAVGNLFKFLANDSGIFIVVEVAHREAEDNGKRRLEDIKVAPIHLLPNDTYRIENLGTGQVRLNYSITETQDRMNWDRSMHEFFEIFGDLAIKHYERVQRDANGRANSIKVFLSNGYQNFQL
jgi:hypothetical protein